MKCNDIRHEVEIRCKRCHKTVSVDWLLVLITMGLVLYILAKDYGVFQ